LKYLFRQSAFFISNIIYRSNYKLIEKRSTVKIALGFIIRSLVFIILGILTAIIVQYLNNFIAPFAIKNGLQIPKDTSYTSFLGTIAGIGGVFIGLYYAAVSTISTAIYNKMSNNVRDLFTKEKYGNSYIEFLAYITFTSLVFLGFHLLGFPRTYLAVIIMIIFSGSSILAFIKLGQRVFYFFDPTTLSDSLFKDLTKNILNVTPKGLKWQDKSFQNHEHELALVQLETLEMLCDYANKEAHLNGRSFFNIANKACKFLHNYQIHKREIPTKSYWYSRKYDQKNWFKADYFSLTTALQTSTKIQPEEKSDNYWLEDRIVKIIMIFIKTNYSLNRYEFVLSILGYIELYLKSLADDLELSKAYDILEEIADILIDDIPNIEKDQILKYSESLERLAIFERFQLISTSLLLRTIQYVEKCNRGELYKNIEKIKWNSVKQIYCRKHPSHGLERLEWLYERISFEKKADGRVITPIWYNIELVSHAEANSLSNAYDVLFKRNSDRFDKWIKRLDKKNRFWLSAALLSNELEYWDKLKYHTTYFSSAWKSIIEDKKIKELSWPDIRFDEFEEISNKRQKVLNEKISEKGLFLVLLNRPESFPDYAGQFIHLSAQKIIDSICFGDSESLIKMFKYFHNASFRIYDELCPDITSKDWRLKYDIERAIIPIVNVMDISGYAKIIAEYYEKEELWTEVKNVWDEYFALDENKGVKVNLLFVIREIYNDTMSLDLVRSNWKIQIKNVLHQVERKMHSQWYNNPIDEIILHKSPIVRIFSYDRQYDFYNGIDMFLVEYILNSELKDLITVSYNEITLKDEIEKEKERWEKLKSDGEVEK
jgi:hypothetical protein